jgi:hypothetical protein
LLLVNSCFCYLTNKETSKGWVCDNFPRQFHFFLGAIHEKHNFKYLKNLTVKVCKIWCNDVYMSILQCDMFWWKLIDRICLNLILIPRWSSGHPPFCCCCSFHCFARDYFQTGYSYMLDISYLFNNNTLKCIKAKIFPFNQK